MESATLMSVSENITIFVIRVKWSNTSYMEVGSVISVVTMDKTT